MRKFIISIMLFCTTGLLANAHIKIEGNTYQFAEKDLLKAIQEKIINNQQEIQDKLNQYKKKISKKVRDYKPDGLNKLTPATKTNIFYPDTTYILDRDIKDANGKVLYPQGFKYNICDYAPLPYEIIVFDANNKEQLNWIIKNNFHKKMGEQLLITDGNIINTMKLLKKRVFFAITPLQKRFKLQHTPSRIVQIGNKIQVTEVYIPKNNKGKENE